MPEIFELTTLHLRMYFQTQRYTVIHKLAVHIMSRPVAAENTVKRSILHSLALTVRQT